MEFLKTCRLNFRDHRGRLLCGQIDVPENGIPLRGVAVYAHCFTCNKNYKAAVYIARALKARGVATLRFDFSGLGGSEGEFSKTTLSDNKEEVIAAANFMKGNGMIPSILIGHSMGGAAAVLAANEIHEVKLVTTIAAPSYANRLTPRLESVRRDALENGSGKLNLIGREFEIGKGFFEDLKRHSVKECVEGWEKKLFVIHDPDDDIVPFACAEDLMNWAPFPKSILKMEGAGHLFTKKDDCERIVEAIIARI